MKKLIIIGASGHGKVVADIAKKNEFDEIVFLDDDESSHECGGYPIVGRSPDAEKAEANVIVAIGNTEIRKRIQESIEESRMVTLIHPDAVVADDATIGSGTVVMAGAVINPGVKIGRGCIINTSSSVDHDCILGNYVHIAVGSHLCGTVSVGNETWIGAGATISNNVNICDNCTIGAGTVVIKDIEKPGVYVGIPAKEKNKQKRMGGGTAPP